MKIIEMNKKLELKNDGNLEVVFIGCGTAFSKKLLNNNFILIKGDTHILVDFGMTGPYALRKNTGLDILDIQTILVTHSHADHIGGLEQLALMHRYLGSQKEKNQKLNMIISENYQRILWDMSLRGGMEWNESSSFGNKLKFEDYFNPLRPKLISNEPRIIYEIDYGDIHLEMFKTNHIPDNASSSEDAFEAYGLFVDDRIFFSCDTKFDKPLIDIYCDKSEYMFHDVSFQKNPVHASLSELNTLDSSIKKKMILMHYADDWEKHNINGFAGLVKQGFKYIF
jgi:ribonuclease BN (tRNA processing enzyme)